MHVESYVESTVSSNDTLPARHKPSMVRVWIGSCGCPISQYAATWPLGSKDGTSNLEPLANPTHATLGMSSNIMSWHAHMHNWPQQWIISVVLYHSLIGFTGQNVTHRHKDKNGECQWRLVPNRLLQYQATIARPHSHNKIAWNWRPVVEGKLFRGYFTAEKEHHLVDMTCLAKGFR